MGLTAVATGVYLLLASAAPAAAHGIDISAELADSGSEAGTAFLEMEATDETGRLCYAIVGIADRPGNSADLVIHPLGQEPTASTGSAGQSDQSSHIVIEAVSIGNDIDDNCVLADVEDVDAMLADVDGHGATLIFADGPALTGQLQKPLPAGFDEDDRSTGVAQASGASHEDSDAFPIVPVAIAILVTGVVLLAASVVAKRPGGRVNTKG